MRLLGIILLLLLLTNAILIIYRPLDIQRDRIVLSIWFKLLGFWTTGFVLFLVVVTAMDEKLNEPYYAVFTATGFAYCLYFALKFGYRFDEKQFRWFNGIYTRMIYVSEIERINLYERNGKTVKIGFFVNGREQTMKDNLSIGFLVKSFASENKISIHQVKI